MSSIAGNGEAAPSHPTDGAAATGPRLVGRFAVFNTWTEINSPAEGHFLERFAPGAFARTFARDRHRMRVLFQHGRDPQIGDKPLGKIISLTEDERGAAFEVDLFDTGYVRELLPGLRAGEYGASFRFQVTGETVNRRPNASAYNQDRLPERTVREALVREFGPVTFPAYEGATAGLRSVSTWRLETRDDEGIKTGFNRAAPREVIRLEATTGITPMIGVKGTSFVPFT